MHCLPELVETNPPLLSTSSFSHDPLLCVLFYHFYIKLLESHQYLPWLDSRCQLVLLELQLTASWFDCIIRNFIISSFLYSLDNLLRISPKIRWRSMMSHEMSVVLMRLVLLQCVFFFLNFKRYQVGYPIFGFRSSFGLVLIT